KKVAFKLLSSFREEDFVFRIGGDEFAVIMVYAKPELKPVVERKIRDCNDFLMSPEDGPPEVSLSVGVAFSGSGGGSGSIYKDADTALYQVKARGRNGVAFFGDDQQGAGDAAPAAGKG
ncbi:MAG: diguanylate cyclase, partial [Mailhella sp.]|nr:diguanylate cyclase [Mailhella sp.]